MRKKKLIELNHQLFENIEQLKSAAEEIQKENARLKKEIEELTQENEALKIKNASSEPLKRLEEKVAANQAVLPEDSEYGAAIIGKTVVSAAKHCNKLSTLHENPNTKELINLILGRTEVAKAEILKIISSDNELDLKKRLIDNEHFAAEEYFQSVLAQI